MTYGKEEDVDRPGISCKDAVVVDWNRGRALLGTMGGRLVLWDFTTGQQLKVLKGHRSCVAAGRWVRCLKSKDVVRVDWGSSQALSASRDKTIRWWRLESGMRLEMVRKSSIKRDLRCSILRGHTSSVCCLLVNWDLRLSMSAGLMDGLRLWSLESKESVEARGGLELWHVTGWRGWPRRAGEDHLL